jgi:polar amino acid transport system substrate-binding protein
LGTSIRPTIDPSDVLWTWITHVVVLATNRYSPARLTVHVDRPGVKVGVSQGSTSQGTLARLYKSATLVPAASLPAAAQMLSKGEIDAFATNKAILFEMADTLSGARVLDGRWGLEHLAIAVPKGREDGMPYMRRFADSARNEGLVKRAAERAGLRGTVEAARP